MAVIATIRAGPRSTDLDSLDKAIESQPIWTELRDPVRTIHLQRQVVIAQASGPPNTT